jgi:NADH-quinone oxidoreductase subunit G
LQDYWLEHGRFQKRMKDEIIHKPKGVSFGPTIVYDAERCIVCTRCVRFVEEIAKDPVLDKRERGNLGEIFVAPGRQLDNDYTLMTEHVCPVGALTSKDFRFKARVWFLRSARAVCQGCATGCSAYLDYDPRNQTVYRYRPRENPAVNQYWMCDPGMLSYRRSHEARLAQARVGGRLAPVADTLAEIARLFSGVSPDKIAIVLSAQHSNEDNYALVTLAKTYLGSGELFLTGKPSGKGDDILQNTDKNPNRQGAMQIASTTTPRSFDHLVEGVQSGRFSHVIALGTDVENAAYATGLGKAKAIVVISPFDGALAKAAHVVLPAAAWTECDGTFVNAKGIAQKSERAVRPRGDAKPAWEWLAAIGRALGYAMTFRNVAELRKAMNPTVASPAQPAAPAHDAAPAE